MTDLERRALLGDTEAQRECAERGIVLWCPFCGTKPRIACGGPYNDSRGVYSSWFVQCTKCGTIERGSHDYFTFCKETGEFVRDGNSKKEAIEKWNTRPAPPIGRCKECSNWDKNTGECEAAADIEVPYHKYTDPDFFCGDFEPKGDE